MKKIVASVVLVLALSACSKTEKAAGIGAATGALIGGAATGSWEGAAIGAAAGGVGGAIIGKASEPGKCRYRDRYGRIYVGSCDY